MSESTATRPLSHITRGTCFRTPHGEWLTATATAQIMSGGKEGVRVVISVEERPKPYTSVNVHRLVAVKTGN